MKSWIRGGIVATGIVGLGFFLASTEANEKLFSHLKLNGVSSEVDLIRVDTTGLHYVRNGGLYHIYILEGSTYKVNLIEDTTIYEHYKVDNGIIYTDQEGTYHSYTFEGDGKEFLNSDAILEVNEGEVIGHILDTDGDGITDDVDNCPLFKSTDQADIDGDGLGNKCDMDIDGDGYSNDLEYAESTNRYKGSEYPANVQPDMNTPPVEPPQVNNDIDGDGVLDIEDNCPTVANYTQWDNNGNGIGNLCDPDIDGDGYSNTEELAAKSSIWEETSTPDNINGYVPPKDCNKV